jgi:hypothetical protein
MSTGNFMQEIDTGWLRGHMRNFIGKSSGEVSKNPLLLEVAKNRNEESLALRVNEVLEGKNKHFAESHAEKLVEQAIEYLKIADEKVQSAELARLTAEAELTRYRDQVKSELDIKIGEIEEKLEQAASQLAAAWRSATAAEERASKAEATNTRLEDELQAQMMRTSAQLFPAAA